MAIATNQVEPAADGQPPEQQPPPQQQQQPSDGDEQIGGMSTLRGLIVYGAVLAFAGLFIDFMVVISNAKTGTKPPIDATLISAAAALAGVLGSAFALKVGVPPSPAAVNRKLAERLKDPTRNKAAAGIRRALSLEPSTTSDVSWPLTFGIWVYAIVATATLVVYVLNQNETPSSVKALAVAFGGYVIALLNMAYGLSKGSSST